MPAVMADFSRIAIGDPDPYKRGDRRRSRTVGRIKCGGGDGGEPVRGPPYGERLFCKTVRICAE